MGKYILLLVIFIASLTSCTGHSSLQEGQIVVEAIYLSNPSGFKANGFKYRLKLGSSYGQVYYYSNLEYKVGDTLVLIPIN